MTLSDFGALCRTLFRNEQGKAYAIENKRLREMFDVFDQNKVSFFYYYYSQHKYFWRIILTSRTATLVSKNSRSAGSSGLNR